MCFALALWNGKDPILKERLFGLTNSEGNHGEEVKEYYFYLDSTPTHSYMKYLYKYPQAAYPYADLVETNRRRTRNEFEYELLDTGVFEGDRYFDVFVEYAKGSPEDILVHITTANRGPETAELHLLPTLWFRNDWASWTARPAEKPTLKQIDGQVGTTAIAVAHPVLGAYYLYCDGDVHVDVIYLAPWAIEQAGADLLGYLQGAWNRSGYDETSEVLALSEAPEARTAHAHYPLSYHTRPVMTVPYRIAYRVVQR